MDLESLRLRFVSRSSRTSHVEEIADSESQAPPAAPGVHTPSPPESGLILAHLVPVEVQGHPRCSEQGLAAVSRQPAAHGNAAEHGSAASRNEDPLFPAHPQGAKKSLAKAPLGAAQLEG